MLAPYSDGHEQIGLEDMLARLRLRPLREQVMVITGASSGIGLATARRAAREGASVFLISRNGEALAERCAEIEQTGARAAFAAADIGNEAQLRAVACDTSCGARAAV